jgi:signal peptidase II
VSFDAVAALRTPISLIGLTATTVLIADILSKRAIAERLEPPGSAESISIIGSTVELVHLENRGVAFGLLDSHPVLAAAGVVAVFIMVLVILIRSPRTSVASGIAAGLLIGGALSNLIDRVGDSRVTDFISVSRWPAFNLADAGITIGAALLLLQAVNSDHPSARRDISDHRITGKNGFLPG